MKKKTGLTAALAEYIGQAQRVKNQIKEYKDLPGRIAAESAALEAVKMEMSEAAGALSKPLDEYKRVYRRGKYAVQNPAAERVEQLTTSVEYHKDQIVGLKAIRKAGLNAFTEAARKDRDAAAVELFNTANLAAARMKIKPPLCHNWERLCIEQIEQRLAPLAEAEANHLAAQKEKRKRKTEEPEATEARVKYVLVDGAAVLSPECMYEAVKVASKSKIDYITLGRGVVAPAAPLVDWLKIVAKDADQLRIKFDTAKDELIAMIGRTKAVFKCFPSPECPPHTVFPWAVYTARCTHRVIMERAR